MRVRGFTLIELLVVIAIIGILAAILLPARRHEPEKDVEVVFGIDEGHGFPVDSDYQRPFGSYSITPSKLQGFLHESAPHGSLVRMCNRMQAALL